MSRQFAPRSVMPASHGQATSAAPLAQSAPFHATSYQAAPVPVAAQVQGANSNDDEHQAPSQKIVMFSEFKFENVRVKPKTRNPDRQKQNFPIRYVDSKLPGGRNLQEMQVAILLGHPDQQNVNSIISPAKAYQRELTKPPENPHILQLGIKFTDPEIVEWITNLNASLLNQLKTSGVTAQDPVRPDIPVEELDSLFKPPFTATEDGGYVGYFSFTDDSLRTKEPAARPAKLPLFEVQPYGYDASNDEIVLFTDEKHAISYHDIVPQEDYCMVVFSLGAMRLDSMSMGNKGTRYPFIGSKLYLDRLIVLRNKEIEAPELPQGDLASLLGKRVRVRVENDESKRAREE